MFNEFYLQLFLALAAPICTSLVSYYLGYYKAKQEFIREKLYDRYMTAYVPFVISLYRNFHFNGFPLNMPAEQRDFYLDFITKNLHLYEQDIVKLYPKLYKITMSMKVYDECNGAEYEEMPRIYQATLMEITDKILLQSTKLSQNLSLPSVAEPCLHNLRYVARLTKSLQKNK